MSSRKPSESELFQLANEIRTLAQAGLFYTKDKFDKERYQMLQTIAERLVEISTDLDAEQAHDFIHSSWGYETPKVDTRAVVFYGEKILLVQEADGRWTLPGGWCDHNLSLAENVRKELFEESGLHGNAVQMIAAVNPKYMDIPEHLFNVVKVFIRCELDEELAPTKDELFDGTFFKQNIETQAAQLFTLENIPWDYLAVEKSSQEMIKLCFNAHAAGSAWQCHFN